MNVCGRDLRRLVGGRRSTRWASLSKLLALALTVSLLLIAVPAATAVPMDRSVVLHSCAVAKYAARCGTLMVPEDRLTGTGRENPLSGS